MKALGWLQTLGLGSQEGREKKAVNDCWGVCPGVRTKPPPFRGAPSRLTEGAGPPCWNHLAVWTRRAWGPGQEACGEH